VSALAERFRDVVHLELDSTVAAALVARGVDVMFPVLHGPPGEDGTFQGLVEILGLPYVGSGVHASACAMDKIVSKLIFRAADLPVAEDVVVRREEGAEVAGRRIRATLGERVVVKPARQGSALGVTLVEDAGELEAALGRAFALDREVLVEARVSGREITCGVLERGDDVEALPVCEIRTPEHSWYDYEHRYTVGLSEHVIPAPLPAAQYERVRAVSILAHEALGCRDLSRVDFVVPDEGEPVLLEVNTLPGMTATSLYPDEARAAGISFSELVALLVERAHARGG
jgi:D-alanine-D-alanine ligase